MIDNDTLSTSFLSPFAPAATLFRGDPTRDEYYERQNPGWDWNLVKPNYLKPRLLSLIEYMLGEQFYEHKGKIIGQRVLDVSGEEGPKIETTFSADAKIKGTSINEIGTYFSIVKPGGILSGQGQGVYTTRDGSGEMASWTGYGVGHITGSGKVSYRGSLFYRTNSTGKLAFLNNLIGVFEYDADEAGNTIGRVWEWKKQR